MNPTLKTGKSSRTIMTNRKGYSSARRLACSRCGTAFSCDPEGDCWCKEETIRLPMPIEGEDCLCRECLSKMVERAASAAAR
jgi:primosomal protein N'